MKPDPRMVRVTEIFESEKVRLSALFGVDLSKVTLMQKAYRGRQLGDAKISRWTEQFSIVRINTNYFENFDSYNHIVTHAITHELVHVANMLKNGWDIVARNPHGIEWKRMMVQAGKSPDATAKVTPHNVTKKTLMVVECVCGERITITKRRWSNRSRYTHKTCGNFLHMAKVVEAG